MRNDKGFTLIELMIVIAIIMILTTISLPSFQDRIIRTQVQEGLRLVDFVKKDIEDYYRIKRKMPLDNSSAGLPVPNKIIANYVTEVKVNDGVIIIKYGNNVNKYINGATLAIRPAIVTGAPKVPITWIPAYATVPKGMTALGSNTSTIKSRFLPMNCRS